MGIAVGSRIGPYEITAPLGAGGMGVVYRAKDTKLNRDVALKVLPPSFIHDAARVARFRREAQVLASLSHAHIGSIYGLEEDDGTTALVLEYVEGPTLADRIAAGPLPLDEALPIADQIADALDAAHEHGIVHRDLKPSNIKVRPDGTVKVLDFGLAKAADPSGAVAGLSDSPTITSPAMTEVGLILGTASYMSPEQARGHTVDKRADIWAFGCVLFEMLTGGRAFPGDSVTDVIANIIRGAPDWSALPATAAPITDILHRCLQKDPRRRFHDAADVKLLLDDAAAGTPSATRALPSSERTTWAAAGLVIGLLLGGAAVTYLWRAQPVVAPSGVARFELPPGKDLPLATSDIPGTNLAISPDGSRVVYTSNRAGVPHLAVRLLDQLDARPIAGTEGGVQPFFSSDGRSLGFATFLDLKRVPMSGGPAVTICPIDAYFSGASWGANDTIVFTEASLGLLQVPSSGGKPVTIALPDPAKGEHSFWGPVLLPDGQSVLYTVRSTDGTERIVGRRLGQPQATTVVEDAFGPRYLPSGRLVFGQGDRIMAAAFDATALKLSGEPVSVLTGNIFMKSADGVMNVAIADSGTMAYVSGRESGLSGRLAWVEPNGTRAAFVSPPLEEPRNVRLSPDGGRVVLTVGPGGQGQLWVFDLSAKAQPLKLTFHDHNLFPIWFPDGKRIAFLMRMGSSSRLCTIPADGSVIEPETLTENLVALPIGWSPDGTTMLMERGQPSKILLLNLAKRDPRPWLQTPFDEAAGRLSPNGAWLAYASSQSGSSEVWLRPFPGPGAPVRVSSEGGGKPLWSHDGSEIFYENGAKMMAAQLRFSASGVEIESLRMLFEGGFVHDEVDPHMRYVDVGPDNRFLVVDRVQPTSAASLVVVQHWDEDLRRMLTNK